MARPRKRKPGRKNSKKLKTNPDGSLDLEGKDTVRPRTVSGTKGYSYKIYESKSRNNRYLKRVRK